MTKFSNNVLFIFYQQQFTNVLLIEIRKGSLTSKERILKLISIITLMIISKIEHCDCMARSFVLSCYNHWAVIILTLKARSFKMAARFLDVSESEIDQYFYFLE